ncbi:hypothetical protein BGZ83_011494 [Gryganskiella cystojenkinii]|nr:hypothetical protein BGZ83_011494 [Gryganskiella cystojenkinii]
MVEVLRDNFYSELPWIKTAIDECDFIAIDAEFSGLHTEPNKRTHTTTMEEGYQELRKSATQFMTVQIGISTFHFDPSNGGYVARPFNFFIFPTTLTGYAPQGRCFLTEASSLDFLARNHFDFNKWVYQGVPYMTKQEEVVYRAERTRLANNDLDVIHIDEASKKFIEDAMYGRGQRLMGRLSRRIKEWKSNPEALNFVNIQCNTAYQRRLVYQEVRRLWPTELHAQGRASMITITQTTPQQQEIDRQRKQSDVERDIEQSRGFRSVIDMLSACKKPIVGHNVVVDLAYIIAQFVGPLPPTMEGYKEMVHRTFPTLIDTKYVSYTAEAFRGLVHDSTLGGLENLVGHVTFMGCPNVCLQYRHNRYFRQMHGQDFAHEAGYDAYITGTILIRMLAHISRTYRASPLAVTATPDNVRKAGSNGIGKNNGSGKTAVEKKNAKYPINLSTAKKNGKEGDKPLTSIATPASIPAPTPAPAPVVPATPAAPKKFSYADIANRQKIAALAAVAAKSAAAAPTPAPAPMPVSTPAGKLAPAVPVVAATVATVPPTPKTAVKEELIKKVEELLVVEEEDGLSNGSEQEYDDDRIKEQQVPSMSGRPFSFDSPAIKMFFNILHWGRSNHGCINLTSS